MKVFYTRKKLENLNLIKKIQVAFDSLILIFVMCVFGVMLFIKEYDVEKPSYDYIETISQNDGTDVVELEIKQNEKKEKFVSQYIKTVGGVDVFQEIFLEKINKNG